MKALLAKCWVGLVPVLAAFDPAGAAESRSILMLVTGAAKMTDGKPTGLWLEEFAVPYQALVEAGYRIEVVTPKGGAAPIDPRSTAEDPQAETRWKEAAERLKTTKPIAQADPAAHAAIFIPGGHGVMFDLASDPAAAKLIEAFERQGKPVAAVCHGPAALVNVKRADGTPLVAGKRLATFTDDEERAVKLDKAMPFLLETRLRELGAKVETRPNFTPFAVRDGNLITGQNPPSSEPVAKLLLEALAEAAR